MYRLREEGRSPGVRTSAIRITVLGALAVAIFSIIFLRLWYLEVLSGDRYLEMARDNQVREIRESGPRGQILDRTGEVLVENRVVLALRLDPRQLPSPGQPRARLWQRLGDVVGERPRALRRQFAAELRELPGSPVTLDVDLTPEQIFYLREHQASYPGVAVERVFTRRYPQGTIAAHLFGNVGEVSQEQLTEPRYQALEAGDLIGQTGVEFEYDRFLRGRPGATRLQVDARGRMKGLLSEEPAEPGHNVRLSLDAQLQETAEAALGSFGLPGAFVAMDVNSGEILAMGSNPSFDPSIFNRSLSPQRYEQLTSEENEAPLTNRAIQGLYPTGSVFKLITALAALDEEMVTPSTIVNDTGELKVDVLTFRNAGDAVFGPIDLRAALKVSSDIYFYRLGMQAPAEGNGGLIQRWARQLGFGNRTGIDLPGEVEGLIPTPAWRDELYAAGNTDRPWRLGDNINFSVGQGDLQATPLQVAVAYAALANGGEVIRPHVGLDVEDVSGRVRQEIKPPPHRQLEIEEGHRQAILEGLHLSSHERGGTSYKVFGNWPINVVGKTGTAERGDFEEDQAWFVAIAPYEDPEIVVAATIEEGGFGVDTAAPVVAAILADHFGIERPPPPPDADDEDIVTTLE